MKHKLFVYKARMKRVVDGDTIDMDMDLGFRTYRKIRVRLEGIDTPEIYGVKKESDEYKRGMKAKTFVENWFEEHSDEDACVIFDSRDEDRGKYGRWIGDIVSIDEEHSLIEDLKGQDFMNV